MVVDTDPVFCGRYSIFHREQYFRNHVHEYGHVKG